MSDHMESPTDPTRTRCNQSIDRLHGPRICSWKYGSPKTTCESCLRLYAKDLSDSAKDLSDNAKDLSGGDDQ